MPRPPAQRIDQPEPGFYKFRRVRQGPWVAAQVILQDGMILVAEDGSQPAAIVSLAEYPDLVAETTMEGRAFGHPLLRILWFGQRINETEHRYLIALAAWARTNAPSHPAANPDQPIDMRSVPIDSLF